MAKSLIKKSDRPKHSPNKPESVKINTIEIEMSDLNVRLAIRLSLKKGFQTSKKWLFEEISEQLPFQFASLKDDTLLYYRFLREKDDEQDQMDEDEIILTIPIKNHKSLLKRYLNEKIRTVFRKDKGVLTNPNFINDIEILIPTHQKGDSKVQMYDCFSIRVQFLGEPFQIKLLIYFTGEKACFSEKYDPINNSDHETSTRFRYKTAFISLNTLQNADFNISYDEVFPFFSAENYQTQKVLKPRTPNRNVVSEHLSKIKKFIEVHLQRASFENHVGKVVNVFQEVEASELFEVDDDDKLLRFYGNQTAMLPKIGFREYGPYQKRVTKPVELIIIKPEGYEIETQTIIKNLFDAGGFSLSNLTKLNISLSKKTLNLKKILNPEPEINEFFRQFPRNPDVQYFVFYLSPFSKHTAEKEELEVYFKIKECLLEWDIPTQSLALRHFDDSNFIYFIPNIASAMIGKLGGTPWVIDKPVIDGIVIGLTAFKEKTFGEMPSQFYGSTFCFTAEGRFLDFDAFSPQEMPQLCGAIKQAIFEYQKLEKEIKHIVIHLNKNLKFSDSVAIEETLKELGVKIPVYLVKITKQFSHDVIAFDSARSHNMLPTGTYTKIGFNHFLLATNEFIDEDGKQSKYPFPIKIRLFKLNEKELSDEEIKKLITQVYQFSKLNFRSISTTPFPITITFTEELSRMSYHFNQRKLDLTKKNQLFML